MTPVLVYGGHLFFDILSMDIDDNVWDIHHEMGHPNVYCISLYMDSTNGLKLLIR